MKKNIEFIKFPLLESLSASLQMPITLEAIVMISVICPEIVKIDGDLVSIKIRKQKDLLKLVTKKSLEFDQMVDAFDLTTLGSTKNPFYEEPVQKRLKTGYQDWHEFIDSLISDNHLHHQWVQPAQDAVLKHQDFDPFITNALLKLDINKLYSHQADSLMENCREYSRRRIERIGKTIWTLSNITSKAFTY